ncbi:MAG: Ni/Fe hydrogenase [Nitrosomonadales bacterium]
MTAPVLIFAIGNESRGDDALGPLLLRQLQEDECIERLEDFQLQIEHAMDMKDRKIVLFIDAGMNTPAPFRFSRARENNEAVLYSHALVPEALLKVYRQFYNEASPPSFILCVRGHAFELGEAPTSESLGNLAAALEFTRRLLINPDVSFWDGLVTPI